jgi:hypothetical protein
VWGITDKVTKYLIMVNLLRIKEDYITVTHLFELNGTSIIRLQNSREAISFFKIGVGYCLKKKKTFLAYSS